MSAQLAELVDGDFIGANGDPFDTSLFYQPNHAQLQYLGDAMLLHANGPEPLPRSLAIDQENIGWLTLAVRTGAAYIVGSNVVAHNVPMQTFVRMQTNPDFYQGNIVCGESTLVPLARFSGSVIFNALYDPSNTEEVDAYVTKLQIASEQPTTEEVLATDEPNKVMVCGMALNYYPSLGVLELGDARVELSRNVQALFDVMYEHNGGGLSDAFLARVLGRSSNKPVSANAIRMTIFNLRSKIAELGVDYSILHVRGRGYVMPRTPWGTNRPKL